MSRVVPCAMRRLSLGSATTVIESLIIVSVPSRDVTMLPKKDDDPET